MKSDPRSKSRDAVARQASLNEAPEFTSDGPCASFYAPGRTNPSVYTECYACGYRMGEHGQEG